MRLKVGLGLVRVRVRVMVRVSSYLVKERVVDVTHNGVPDVERGSIVDIQRKIFF